MPVANCRIMIIDARPPRMPISSSYQTHRLSSPYFLVSDSSFPGHPVNTDPWVRPSPSSPMNPRAIRSNLHQIPPLESILKLISIRRRNIGLVVRLPSRRSPRVICGAARLQRRRRARHQTTRHTRGGWGRRGGRRRWCRV